METHPKGTSARVLLSSVFGPYAQDDEFGSRSINPMELYYNQVTRMQGAYSPRLFHRSWGIMMIQENISAPCTVLDFPTREAFAREITEQQYDIVGISSIIVNVGKVREMCRIVRKLSPHSKIVVGGHVAAIPGIDHMVDADHVVKGEGIRWMREFLGEDPTAPVRHPRITSGFNFRIMGRRFHEKPEDIAVTIIPSVGCPMGCNFCTTSAFFGGKGKSVNFYETGRELFDIMCEMEAKTNTRFFFVMDENFLLNRTRAMELLALMKQHNKSWGFYVFASANAIRKYTIEELVELGVAWIWMGLESRKSHYDKLNGTDTVALVRELREHGIKALGSTIIGLEHHTPDNIQEEVEQAIAHDTEFHQFMLYTPVPGTPLYKEMQDQGRLLPGDLADSHGQFKFNFKHAAIGRDDSKRVLDWAFLRDFELNGPSIYRICRTMLQGWRRYKDYPDPRVRERYEREGQELRKTYGPALWAIEHELRETNAEVSRRVGDLRRELEAEFGSFTRWVSRIAGPIMLWSTRREERKLAQGKVYEPPTFLERRNWAASS